MGDAHRPWRDVTLFDGFDFVQVRAGSSWSSDRSTSPASRRPRAARSTRRRPSGRPRATAPSPGTTWRWAVSATARSCRTNPTPCTTSPTSSTARSPPPARTSEVARPNTATSLASTWRRWPYRRAQSPTLRPAHRCAWARSATPTSSAGLRSQPDPAPPISTSRRRRAPQTPTPATSVSYTSTVTNPSVRPPGDPLAGTPVDAATNLVVADPLPSGVDFVALTSNPGNACSYSAATRIITCKVGTLNPDATSALSMRHGSLRLPRGPRPPRSSTPPVTCRTPQTSRTSYSKGVQTPRSSCHRVRRCPPIWGWSRRFRTAPCPPGTPSPGPSSPPTTARPPPPASSSPISSRRGSAS